MSVTVLEALENAKFNIETLGRMGAKEIHPFIYAIAHEQLSNAIKALDDGLDANDTMQGPE